MQAKRTKALTDLKLLAENLRYGGIALSDAKLVEVLAQICIWAGNAGTKSSLFEINEQNVLTEVHIN